MYPSGTSFADDDPSGQYLFNPHSLFTPFTQKNPAGHIAISYLLSTFVPSGPLKYPFGVTLLSILPSGQ